MYIRLLAKQMRHTDLNDARSAGILLCFIVSILLSGCASRPALLESTYQTLPSHVELNDVPFHPQVKYQCGPATLAMVLNHQGVDASVERLIPQVFIPGRDGSVQPEMLATARRYERIAFPIRGTLDSLLTHLAGDDPVVVMQNLSLPAWPMWHYAVAIGYDLPNETLILRSGEIERHMLSFSRFDATWARTERWGFVIAPPGEVPAGISPKRAMDAISAYEALHGANAALPSWKALTQRQPNNAMGFFALSNAYYALNQVDDARETLIQATNIDPELGVAWLNLGLLYLAQERLAKAEQTINKAAQLPGPWQERAASLLKTL
ncbi:PA2778 family cysteine peptidase [Halomonas llamarensis]|uniref:PA2778 family cysteine peptidase n=1 Tax=Halomonas llamarensis TaxID=2945104 RepID=A0ABT0SQD5_9GAMM|nr:PA2778 family cysteine peptidase [Halomonas llamarensis]MCL7930023.1 PA2778 family cysteine peptidase [Halomonas llamarensis]